MQYEKGNENLIMASSSYAPIRQPLSLNENVEIQRTRKILLIILGVFLALSILGIFGAIAGSGSRYNVNNTSKTFESIASSLFFAFGFLVTYRYSEIGLRVFAWLNIIGVVLSGIGVVVLLFMGMSLTAVAATSDGDNSSTGLLAGLSIMAFILVAVYLVIIIITIIVIKLAFKLAKLINANKSQVIQQA